MRDKKSVLEVYLAQHQEDKVKVTIDDVQNVSMMSTLFDQDKLWARHVRGYGRDQYEDGMAKGMADGIVKVAQNFLASGFSKDDIAKNTGLSLEEVEKLAARIAH